MSRVIWSKIAKYLKENYVEDMKCKVCGQTIPEGENALRTLNNIYRHFKEEHPDIIEKVKNEIV